MRQTLGDSAFGRLLNLASRGRLFPPTEVLDPSLLEPYMPGAQTHATTPSFAPSIASDLEKEDLEKANGERALSDVGLGTTPGTNNGDNGSKGHQLIDWNGPNDPENPRNWSTGKKFFVTFEVCFLTMSVYIGSAIYTAGLPGVEEQFDVSQTVALLGLTLFVIGYALGPMLWAPMSEMPFFGRMPIYIGTLFGFIFLNFGVIYAKNIGMLLAFRFLTGFVGSPCLATGGATIQDMYTPKLQIYGIAVWGISAVLGPTLGPLIGGFANVGEGWTWTIWELVWLSGACFCFIFFFFPETSSTNILYRRTIRYRKATGNTKLKCEAEIEAEGMTGRDAAMMILVRPFTMTFAEPIVFVLNLYIALIYGLLYLWFESFPLVFIGIYHFTAGTAGLAFLGLLVGGMLVLPCFFLWSRYYMEPHFNEKGDIHPELRIRPAMVGAFFIPICLFWFGWSARPSIHWIMPIIGSGFFSVGAFLLFMSVLGYLGDAYPKHVASVYASNDLVRSSFGAAFPLFANAMFHKLGIDWASSMLGFFAIAFIPIPFVLYKYGERIRHASKMARHDM